MLPTSTNVSIELNKSIPATANAVAVFVTEKSKSASGENLLGDAERAAARRLLAAGAVQGKAKEIVTDLVDLAGGKHRVLFAVGLGAGEKVTADGIREAAGALAKAARKQKVKNLAVVLPLDEASVGAEEAAHAVTTGLLLASFRYEEYKGTVSKKKAEDESAGRMSVTLVAPADQVRNLKQAVETARVIADGQNYARTIASRPGNNINPPTLAKVAQEMAKELGLGVRVLEEKQMTKLGMGGILAVGSASANPPRMIVVEHKPARAAKGQKPLLVVGKAITFDTGGISIKPAERMGRMVFDKCGAMAVLGLMYAVAKLKLPVHVVGILSSAENTLGGTAYRPGDILRMYNGVTVEVTNTDAEGRLVLGDALAWGIETYKPAAVVDLATLTGGVVVALGKTMAGVMSNNDELVKELEGAASAAGEKFWRLPLGDEYSDLMKSEPADIVNSGPREAHPIQGGIFLSYFVPQDNSVPWAHLDIAGVADTEKELPLYAKGATGWGVRTLVEWVTRRAEA